MTGNGSLPTMKDVAREAGVALGTVSKVFNDIPVGDSYRQRVLDAADKLGYQVNSYARGLKTNKTRSVALIIPEPARLPPDSGSYGFFPGYGADLSADGAAE